LALTAYTVGLPPAIGALSFFCLTVESATDNTGSWEIKSIEPTGLVGFELGLINLCSLSKVWSAILN